jgi:hypothetical protein
VSSEGVAPTRTWFERNPPLARSAEPSPADSRDHVAESLRILANASIAGYHGDELRGFAQQLRGGQVDRIERADRLDWKGTTGACQDRIRDADDRGAAFECLERSNRRAFLVWRQSSRDSRPPDAARGFSQCQGRRDASPWSTHRRSRGGILFKERSQKTAGFDVQE